MKNIYLVRHGKAETPIPEMPDYDRILTDRGVLDMQNIAKTMKKLGIRPSVIITSPAARAYQTARIAASELGYPLKKIRTRMALYDQFESAVGDIIKSLDDNLESVLLVGHNPSISEFARFLSKKFDKDVPTSGMIVFKCKIKTWADLKSGKGKCVCFDCPGIKDSPEKEKMLRTALKKTLTEHIENALVYYDESAPKSLEKIISKSSEAVAKAYMKKQKKTAKK